MPTSDTATPARETGVRVVAELAGVSKRFGDTVALAEVDLAIRAGEVVAVLGPNGAGKTTAVRLMMGLMAPDRGRSELFGGDPRDWRHRCRVGAMLQVSGVPETLTVTEVLRSFMAYYPDPTRLEQTLETAGLTDIAERRVQRLSGGQQQRVLFGLALCGNPELLFLDEPTVGLDVSVRQAFWKEIRRQAAAGKTVVLTTHYLDEADALADRIVILNQGQVIADGTPEAIKGRVPGARVRCRTTLSQPRIAGLVGVIDARVEGGWADLTTARPEGTVAALLAADPELRGLEVSRAALEEAFLDLVAPRRAA